eukprot:101106_1
MTSKTKVWFGETNIPLKNIADAVGATFYAESLSVSSKPRTLSVTFQRARFPKELTSDIQIRYHEPPSEENDSGAAKDESSLNVDSKEEKVESSDDVVGDKDRVVSSANSDAPKSDLDQHERSSDPDT